MLAGHRAQDIVGMWYYVIKNHHGVSWQGCTIATVCLGVHVWSNKCCSWCSTSSKKAGFKSLENCWWTGITIIRVKVHLHWSFGVKEDFSIFIILKKIQLSYSCLCDLKFMYCYKKICQFVKNLVSIDFRLQSTV